MASPWLKFFPTDWQSDPALRMCSLAARGLWAEMLCLMHKADPYGSLMVNGIAIIPKQLAMLCGAPAREVETCLQELERAGVFSRDDNGTIYSRRMRRDFEKAERDKANGKGGGNPKLTGKVKGGVNPPSNPKPKEGVKAQSQKPESESKSESPSAQHSLSSGLRAGSSLISPEAHTIAEELWQVAGFSKETLPPGWCGSPMAIGKWLKEGCPGEVVKIAVIAVLKRKTPANFAYFDSAIAQAFANHKRPLPQVIVGNPKPIEVRNGYRSPSWAELATESIQSRQSAHEAEARSNFEAGGGPVIELAAVPEQE